jgi:hypothetical protein
LKGVNYNRSEKTGTKNCGSAEGDARPQTISNRGFPE